ncbi:MAG: MFS transporter [Clostridia bacterium]|nr:MFS transporter [Clostridia bacterium]
MEKITGKGKIILYAASGLGINMLNLMMTSYLCSALLVGGFSAEAVPNQTYLARDLVVPAVWAVFALVAKIIDGVIDIPMAAFTDGLRTRFGRRRPALLIGLIPLVMAYCAFLIIPHPQGASVLNTVYYGLILCVFYSFYTLTMVNYYATFTEIVETQRERSLLSNAKSVFDIMYFILGYVVVRMLLNGLNIRIVALIVLPLSLTMLIPLFMIKEPDLTKAEMLEKSPRLSLFRSIAYTFKNRTFILWMIAYSFMTFGVQLFLGGINEYFSFVGINMIFVMMAAFAPVPFTLMIYERIIRKHGFGAAYRYVLVSFAMGALFLFGISFMPQGTLKTVLSVISGLVCSLGIGALFAVAYSVPSQLAADEEKKTGVSNSAMYFAVQGLFAGIATGIGTGIVLTALKGSETSNSGAIKYMTLICAVAVMVSFALTFTLPKAIRTMGKEENKKK